MVLFCFGKPINGFRLRPYHRRVDPENESVDVVVICHIEPLIEEHRLHGAPFYANQIAAHDESDEEPVFCDDDSLKRQYGRCRISKKATWKNFIGGFLILVILIWAGLHEYKRGIMHYANTFFTRGFCTLAYTLCVFTLCVNLALCVAMAPEVNYLPLNPVHFESRDDRHWLQRTRLAEFYAVPIAAQPVRRPDLTKVIMKPPTSAAKFLLPMVGNILFL